MVEEEPLPHTRPRRPIRIPSAAHTLGATPSSRRLLEHQLVHVDVRLQEHQPVVEQVHPHVLQAPPPQPTSDTARVQRTQTPSPSTVAEELARRVLDGAADGVPEAGEGGGGQLEEVDVLEDLQVGDFQLGLQLGGANLEGWSLNV